MRGGKRERGWGNKRGCDGWVVGWLDGCGLGFLRGLLWDARGLSGEVSITHMESVPLCLFEADVRREQSARETSL